MASFTSSDGLVSNSTIVIQGEAVEMSVALLESPHLHRAGAHPIVPFPECLPHEVSHFSDDEDDLTWIQKLRSPRAIQNTLGGVSKMLSYKSHATSVSSTPQEKTTRLSNFPGLGRPFRSQSQSSVTTSSMTTFMGNASSSTINHSWSSHQGSSPTKTFSLDSPATPYSMASTPSIVSPSPRRRANSKPLKHTPVSPIVNISRKHPRILKPSRYDQFDFGFPLQDYDEEDEEKDDVAGSSRRSPIHSSHQTPPSRSGPRAD